MVQYKLIYFNGEGRGEPARIMFALAGVDYEDERIDSEEWRIKLKKETEYGHLPILVRDGVRMHQSTAINAFLAREFGLYGSTNADHYEIAKMAGIYEDLIKMWPVYERDLEIKAKKIEELLDGEVKECFKTMECGLKENSLLLGSEISLGDIIILRMCDFMLKSRKDFFSDLPKLTWIMDRVRSEPKIKAWIDKRPETAF